MVSPATPIAVLSLLHLICLCLWGGVVLTEAVLEIYPFRRRELHAYTVQLHYWIDLLVELPLIAGVTITGVLLAILVWPLSPLHLVKVVCACVAVGANLHCIYHVLSRRRALDGRGEEATLCGATRRIVISAVVGIPFAAAAVVIGFWLALHRLAG